MTATEALAQSWASIDGKLDMFLKGKGRSETAYGGHYGGYMAEAKEMQKRLAKRGYEIHRAQAGVG